MSSWVHLLLLALLAAWLRSGVARVSVERERGGKTFVMVAELFICKTFPILWLYLKYQINSIEIQVTVIALI